MKIRLPKLPKVFARKKKKLRLSAARRATASGAEFEEMSEPNMKLSRALLIVLLLHVVAVGGIIAFNAIKSRQGSAISTAAAAKSMSSPLGRHTVEATPMHSPASKPEKKSKPAEQIPEGAKTYTVAKGDNPLTIAKKFKVPYDDLLAANHIDDPRKLKIGQKLLIPVKARPKKTDG